MIKQKQQSWHCRLDENAPVIEDEAIPDIRSGDRNLYYPVPEPVNRDGFTEMKQKTPARIGIWRTGSRYLTEAQLRFRADHSTAQDSVWSYVSPDFLKKNNLFSINTLCRDKEDYITNPDHGRVICEEGVKTMLSCCRKKPTVQIFIADGLSSAAIEANSIDVMKSLMAALDYYRIDYGTPFFIRHSRVATEDQVCELLGATVVCQLIGERPGLTSAESMSAYIAYKATVGMLETRRTVVSNIHKAGTLPVEAGAHIADIIKLMLEKKASGTELKR
jgi:ethanolamine ammonia-lyase small subunit